MELTTANKRTLAQKIKELEKHAVPGNWAWRKIEELQGYEGDYTEADHGTHWTDNATQ